MKDLVSANMGIELPDDTIMIVKIDGYVHYHTEKNYGADTDGGRGESRTFIEDITDVQAIDDTYNDVPLNDKNIEEANGILTRKFLEG